MDKQLKKAIKEAGREIADVVDALPTEQMVLDLIEGTATRLGVEVMHIKLAVNNAQSDDYQATQDMPGNFGSNVD